MSRPEVDQMVAELLKSMSPEEAIEVLSAASEFESIPPTIDQFLDNTYYLAHIGQTIFPFWREQLRIIHPSPYFCNKSEIAISGSTGGGAFRPLM